MFICLKWLWRYFIYTVYKRRTKRLNWLWHKNVHPTTILLEIYYQPTKQSVKNTNRNRKSSYKLEWNYSIQTNRLTLWLYIKISNVDFQGQTVFLLLPSIFSISFLQPNFSFPDLIRLPSFWFFILVSFSSFYFVFYDCFVFCFYVCFVFFLFSLISVTGSVLNLVVCNLINLQPGFKDKS